MEYLDYCFTVKLILISLNYIGENYMENPYEPLSPKFFLSNQETIKLSSYRTAVTCFHLVVHVTQ